jgi:hypothetical protein
MCAREGRACSTGLHTCPYARPALFNPTVWLNQSSTRHRLAELKMKAREACTDSQHKAAVRYTIDGRPMIFDQTEGRVFLQTSTSGREPEFREVKVSLQEEFLNYSDWKPWTGPTRPGWFPET